MSCFSSNRKGLEMEEGEDEVVRKDEKEKKEVKEEEKEKEESMLLMKNTCFVPSCQLHLVASWAGRE